MNLLSLIIKGAVRDITGIAGVNEIALYWLAPADYADDGQLSQYNVTCRHNAMENLHYLVLFPNNNHLFSSLEPFTSYNCCIEAHWTTNGVGPVNCIEQTTLEDGKLLNVAGYYNVLSIH